MIVRRAAGGVGQGSPETVGLAEAVVRGGECGQQVYVELPQGLAALVAGKRSEVVGEFLRVWDLKPSDADRFAQLADPCLELEQADSLPVVGVELGEIGKIARLHRRCLLWGIGSIDLGDLPAEPEGFRDAPIGVTPRRELRVGKGCVGERSECVSGRAGAHGCPLGSPAWRSNLAIS